MELDKIYNEDCLEGLKKLPDNSVDCCVTSPPYYALRDYGTGHWEGGDPNCPHCRTNKVTANTATGHKGMAEKGAVSGDAIYKTVCPLCGAVRVDKQIGLEETPEEYIEKLVRVFTEVYRVLKPEGTLWLNIGDSYWGGGWRNSAFNEHSGNIQKGSKGTYCGDTMPALKGKQGSYKPKDLIGIPWMLAFALRASGWYLRQDIIWHKPNPMPESVTDRCTKSHEYIFLLSKSQKYYFDNEAIQEEAVTQIDPRIGNRVEYDGKRKGQKGQGQRAFVALKVKLGSEEKPHWGSGTKKDRTHNQNYSQSENGGHRDNSGGFDSEMSIKDGVVVRNKRDVWTVNVKPDSVAHFATYPEELIKPCILAGCRGGGIVLDPFMGSGTTARVARMLNRHFVGFELNSEYCKIINNKTQVTGDLFY